MAAAYAKSCQWYMAHDDIRKNTRDRPATCDLAITLHDAEGEHPDSADAANLPQ